jgi:hypothetical protein
MERRSYCYLFVFVGMFVVSGCGASAWSPAPPRGQSWSYGRQGALRGFASVNSHTTGNLRITTHRAALYRTDGPVSPGQPKRRARGWAANSRLSFNAQLASQGERLEPSTIARQAAQAAIADGSKR